MTLTLGTARDSFRDYTDDDGAAGETRWSDTQVDRYLSLALSMCIDDYTGGGGDRFDLLTSVTTTALGVSDLSSLGLNTVRGVALNSAGRYWRIKQTSLEDRNIDDLVIRTLQVRYTRFYTLPTTTNHPLVGVGAVAAPSWDTFDHWIVARAALIASTKDADARQDLKAILQDLAGTIMTLKKIPGGMPFPGPDRMYGSYLRWVWNQSTQILQMTRVT